MSDDGWAGSQGSRVGRQGSQVANQVRAVEIRAEVYKVSTMSDGSFHLILNLPEDCLPQVQQLMAWHKLEVKGVLEVQG